MPMIDLTYPEGALDADALATAVERLTATLLEHEGAPDNEATRAMSWLLVHELTAGAMYLAGRPAEKPLYRVQITVPQGTAMHGPGPLAARQRHKLVRAVTEIVLDAEGGGYTAADAVRVFCLIHEVHDGHWGGLGTVFRIEDIAAIATPELPQTPASRAGREALGV